MTVLALAFEISDLILEVLAEAAEGSLGLTPWAVTEMTVASLPGV